MRWLSQSTRNLSGFMLIVQLSHGRLSINNMSITMLNTKRLYRKHTVLGMVTAYSAVSVSLCALPLSAYAQESTKAYQAICWYSSERTRPSKNDVMYIKTGSCNIVDKRDGQGDILSREITASFRINGSPQSFKAITTRRGGKFYTWDSDSKVSREASYSYNEGTSGMITEAGYRWPLRSGQGFVNVVEWNEKERYARTSLNLRREDLSSLKATIAGMDTKPSTHPGLGPAFTTSGLDNSMKATKKYHQAILDSMRVGRNGFGHDVVQMRVLSYEPGSTKGFIFWLSVNCSTRQWKFLENDAKLMGGGVEMFGVIKGNEMGAWACGRYGLRY
jgi:hypothetical protein